MDSNDQHRFMLEEECSMLAKAIVKTLRPGIGFCLILYDFGPSGNMAYMANAQREDMVKLLSEVIKKLKE